MKKVSILIFLAIFAINVFGQWQAFNWLIGDYNMSFNQPQSLDEQFPLVDISGYSINTNNSTLSDTNGNLIVYSKGNYVYNEGGNPVNFLYPPVTNQPCILLGDTSYLSSEYIRDIFYLSLYPDFYYYDLNLSYYENFLNISSKMAVYKEDFFVNKTFVMLHGLNTDRFLLFSKNEDGLDSIYVPDQPTYGSIFGEDYDSGFMKFSTSGSFLAVTSPDMNDLRIYSFNVLNNTMSSIYVDDTSEIAFNAIEFAARDENILYAADDYNIYQIICQSAIIGDTMQIIGTSANQITNMHIAPDGKIYVAKQGSDYLGVIHNPERIGFEAVYDDYAVYLPNPNGTLSAFPANYFKNIPIITWWSSNATITNETEVYFNAFTSYNADSVVWYFSDTQTSSQNETHIFQNSGIFDVTAYIYSSDANALWDSVAITKKVTVNPKIIANITPDYVMLCDTFSYVNLSVDYDENDFNIYWGAENDIYYTDMYGSDINVNLPDKYWVDIYDLSWNHIASDTVIVDYEKCNDLTLEIVANQISACNNNVGFEFSAQITNNSTYCSFDEQDFYYIWDLGKVYSQADVGLTSINYVFEESGIYPITLYMFDSKGCEHIAKLEVNTNSVNSDTLKIVIPELSDDEITINLAQYGLYDKKFFDNSYFISNPDRPIDYFETFYDTLSIPAGTINNFLESDDFYLYLNAAYYGDFLIELISPSGESDTVCDVCIDYTDYSYLLGHPTYYYDTNNLSVCHSYFFADNSNPISYPNAVYALNIYYSPDKHLFRNTDYPFYYAPMDFYEFKDIGNLVGRQISGNWTLAFHGWGGNGRIKSWGLIFINEYYESITAPVAISCSDQNGNHYAAVDSVLTISHTGENDYTLDCIFEYESGCNLTKVIFVDVPDAPYNPIPNSFTPNGDGINDFWQPIEYVVSADIYIIDKNGQIVIQYRNEDFPGGWDGTVNDKSIPSDSYWYLIFYDAGGSDKGVITIIR